MADTIEHDADLQSGYFGVEVKGLDLVYFTQFSGISMEYDVIEFKQVDGKNKLIHKRPGKPKYGEITLKRGLTDNTALLDWFKQVTDAAGPIPYKDVAVVIYDYKQEEQLRYNFGQCWPSKLTVTDPSASSTEVMVEELTLQTEFLDWAKP